MRSNPELTRWLNIAQIIVEIIVAAGYLLALIPFMYLVSGGWVVPLTIVSFIISIVQSNNRTTKFTVINFAMSLLSFIPVVGYVPRIVGAMISVYTIRIIQNQR